MIDSHFRKPYQKFLVEPIVCLKITTKCTPNFLTFLAAFFGITTLPLLATQHHLLALFTLLTSGFFDTLDGSLARKLGLISNKGACLDIFFDRLVELSVLIGLFLFAPPTRALPVILMVGSVLLCITSFLVVGVFSNKDSEKSFHYSPGIIERAEAFLFFCLMILFPSYFAPLAYTFSSLVFITALVRLTQFTTQDA